MALHVYTGPYHHSRHKKETRQLLNLLFKLGVKSAGLQRFFDGIYVPGVY